MTTSQEHRRADEAGIGIMMAFGVGLLLMAMCVLAISLLNIGQNSSARHLGFEQAINVSEQGIDTALAEQQAAEGTASTDAAWDAAATAVTGTASPTAGQLPATVDTVDEEEAWLRERTAWVKANKATPAVAALIKKTPEGDYVYLNPSNRQTVYSVGWIPNVETAKQARYIKAEWLFSTWRPDHALLVNGDLSMGGSSSILGIAGNVHANGDIDLNAGGGTTISGTISTSGTITSSPALPTGGVPNYETGSPLQDVPDFNPRLIWDRQHVSYASEWYDLCPDGTVRRPTNAAGPCTGVIEADTSAGAEFRGFKLSGDDWDYSGNSTFDGVYYAYQKNIKVGGNPGEAGAPWKATLITEAIAGGASGSCTTTRSYGDIQISGNPGAIPFITGLGFIAGRDLKLNGNPGSGASGIYSGFYAAVEQVQISGNPKITGSVVAQGLCDTPGSMITDNQVNGNPTITYDGGLDVLVGATIRTALWLEL